MKKCSKREFENHSFAWKVLDGEELRVPAPLRFVADHADDRNGYLVMEFLEGKTWEEDSNPSNDVKVQEAVRYMHKTAATTASQQIYPGPLDREHAFSFPWGRAQKEAESTFKSMQDAIACVEKRLRQHARRFKTEKRTINLAWRELTICQGDLAPRNFLILTSGQVALLDWEWLCMYPSIFDLACLSAAKCLCASIGASAPILHAAKPGTAVCYLRLCLKIGYKLADQLSIAQNETRPDAWPKAMTAPWTAATVPSGRCPGGTQITL